MTRLQAAIASVGPDDLEEKKVLDAALMKDKTQVEDRIAQSMKFVERAKKRLAAAETELQSAVQKKSQRAQEVAEAEADLARMREEVPVPAEPDEDAKVEVQRLKARLAQLESIQGRPARGSVEAAENIRSKVAKRRVGCCAEDLSCWLDEKQGGTPRCIGHGRNGVRRHNHWIDLKRTCQVGKFLSATHLQCRTWSHEKSGGKCGFRGVRVGEASHPGPSSRLRPRAVRVRSRSRSGDLSREARLSPDEDTFVSVAPATTLPAINTLPSWPDSDSHVDIGNLCVGCSAGRVPLDVLDALEEDLGHGEGGAVAPGASAEAAVEFDSTVTRTALSKDLVLVVIGLWFACVRHGPVTRSLLLPLLSSPSGSR